MFNLDLFELMNQGHNRDQVSSLKFQREECVFLLAPETVFGGAIEWISAIELYIWVSTVYACISFVSELFGFVMSKKGFGRPSKVRSSRHGSATGPWAGNWAFLKCRIELISDYDLYLWYLSALTSYDLKITSVSKSSIPNFITWHWRHATSVS